MWLIAGFIIGYDKDDDDGINQTDRDFTKKATMDNFAEVDAGQLASTKGSTPGVRQYGQMMVVDHTGAKAQLQAIAANYHLYAPDSLDTEHVALKNQLMTLTGRAFDSVYMKAQARDHEKTIELFEREKDDGDNRALRNYVRELLPHLRHHLHMADSIAAQY